MFYRIEAPSQHAVEEMHRNAHGLAPNEIIAVDLALVEGFLGRITDPGVEASATALVISEPAFRTVLTARLHAGPFDHSPSSRSSPPRRRLRSMVRTG